MISTKLETGPGSTGLVSDIAPLAILPGFPEFASTPSQRSGLRFMANVPDRTRTDDELMEAFNGCSRDAYSKIVLRHTQALHNFIWRSIRDTDETEDLWQNTNLKLFLAKGKYRPGGGAKFSTWYFTIAYNLIRNHWRWKERKGLRLTVTEEPPDANTPGDHTIQIESGDKSPLEIAEFGDDLEPVFRCLKTLHIEEQIVIELSVFQELSHQEISRTLGISVSQSRVRLCRGLQHLREGLGV